MICGYSLWAVAFICAGVFCASFVDAIGGGGGLISVPVYLLAGLPTHYALGTNKLSSGIGTAVSAFRYLKSGALKWTLAAPAVALALIGAHIGTRLQIMADERLLKYMLLAVLPIAAAVMLRRKQFAETEGDISPARRYAVVWAASLALGVYDGFYGPGTGTFLLIIFCSAAKMSLRSASAAVKVINFSSNMGALATSALAGKVLAPIGLMAAVFSIAGHYIGSGLTLKNGAKIVRPVIFVVLGLLAVRVISELV